MVVGGVGGGRGCGRYGGSVSMNSVTSYLGGVGFEATALL